jgi:hypothetical protein
MVGGDGTRAEEKILGPLLFKQPLVEVKGCFPRSGIEEGVLCDISGGR